MSKSIAGANMTGHLAERYVAINKLSQIPFAILAIVFALAGAITIKSAQSPRSTWFVHSPFLFKTKSLNTGFLLSVLKVKGVTNSLAAGVIITFTLAPALTSNLTKKAAL